MLKLISASKIYDSSGVAALRSIDLHVAPGDYVSVTGASGSGKSTLMHVLGLLDTLSSGSYLLCGTDVSHLSAAALAARRASQIGFVFQQFQLLPGLTALENTALPLAITGVPRAVRLSRARTALCSVGLGDRMNHLSSSALPSPAPLSRVPACSSPMSRPQGSTRPPLPMCCACSTACTRAATPSCSSRMTRRRRAAEPVVCASNTANFST